MLSTGPTQADTSLLPGATEPSAPSRPEAGGVAEVSEQSLVRKDLGKGGGGAVSTTTAAFILD